MQVKTLYEKLSEIFPSTLSCEWDHDGMMCMPSPKKKVKRVLCTLDATEDVISYAAAQKVDVILTHHPMIFRPIDCVSAEDSTGRKINELVRNDIALFSFHTRMDSAEAGINAELARRMHLKNVTPLDHLGRVGDLTGEQTLSSFLELVCREVLSAPCASFVDADRPVSRVAVVSGSGVELFRAALAAGADTLLTGTPKHEMLLEAHACGLNVICAGHFETEVIAGELLARAVECIDSEIYTCTYDIPVIKWYQTEIK